MPRYFLLTYEVVENYAELRLPFRQLHLDYAAASAARGELLLGGAMADPVDQALLLFRAESAKVAASFAESDPYVKNHLIRRWFVREWTPVAGCMVRHLAQVGT